MIKANDNFIASSGISVSEIQFLPVKPKDGLFGFVSFVVNQILYCGSVAVYTRLTGGIRLVWPQVENRGIKYPAVYPVDKATAIKIEQQVEEKIGQVLALRDTNNQ